MKVERITQSPPLYDFIRTRLPSSLEARCHSDGYGTVYTVHVVAEDSGHGFGAWLRRISSSGIATVYDHTVELRRPEYFSDFEMLCREFENVTGKEVTLRYWASP